MQQCSLPGTGSPTCPNLLSPVSCLGRGIATTTYHQLISRSRGIRSVRACNRKLALSGLIEMLESGRAYGLRSRILVESSAAGYIRGPSKPHRLGICNHRPFDPPTPRRSVGWSAKCRLEDKFCATYTSRIDVGLTGSTLIAYYNHPMQLPPCEVKGEQNAIV